MWWYNIFTLDFLFVTLEVKMVFYFNSFLVVEVAFVTSSNPVKVNENI